MAVGRGAAAALLALRTGETPTTSRPRRPGAGPGCGSDPAVVSPWKPDWGRVTPYLLGPGSRFRPPPPPALTGGRYASDFQEVKAVGEAASTTRTPHQTETARFWNATGAKLWNQAAQQLVLAHGHEPTRAARAFALLNLAGADAVIATWDAKFTYHQWRPVTAIRAAADDGNPATDPDPDWTPLLTTPPTRLRLGGLHHRRRRRDHPGGRVRPPARPVLAHQPRPSRRRAHLPQLLGRRQRGRRRQGLERHPLAHLRPHRARPRPARRPLRAAPRPPTDRPLAPGGDDDEDDRRPAASRQGGPRTAGPALLGSGLDLLRDPLGTYEQARRTYGDVVRFVVGPPGRRTVLHLVFEPDLVRQALADHGHTKGMTFYTAIAETLGDALLTSDGARWRRQRRIIQPLFTASAWPATSRRWPRRRPRWSRPGSPRPRPAGRSTSTAR